NENLGLFILLFILFLIVGLVAVVISYAFVPIYLNLYNKTNGTNFSTQEIVNEYRANIGIIFIFLLRGFLLTIPMLVGTMISLFLLVITIVGILATPLVIAFVSLFYNMTLMVYIENKRNIWDS